MPVDTQRDEVAHAYWQVNLEEDLLRHVADRTIRSGELFTVDGYSSPRGCLEPEDHAQQCRLSRSVRSNESRELTFVDSKVDILKYHAPRERYINVFNPQQIVPRHFPPLRIQILTVEVLCSIALVSAEISALIHDW